LCEEQLKIFQKVLLTSSLFALSSASLAETSNSVFKNNNKESNSIFEKPILIAETPVNYIGFDTLKITVTGTRTERSIKDVPSAVSSFDYDEINSMGPLDWRSLFKYDASISSQDFSRSDGNRTYASGDKGNINIRGLEGNRVLTLIDGIPIPRFSYGRSGTFAASRLNYVDFNNLGNVEVLKGAGSSLYGSDAMGGVVSLRGLDPDDLLEEGQNSTFEISSPYNSQNSSYQPSLKFAFRDNDLAGIFSVSAGKSNELNRKTKQKYINDSETELNSYYGKLVKTSGNTKYNLTLENLNKDTTSTNSTYYNEENNLKSQKDKRNSERTRISLGIDYKSKEDKFIDNFSAKIYTNAMENKSDYETITNASVGRFGPVASVDSNTKVTLKQDMIGGNIQFSNNIKTRGTDQKFIYGLEVSHNDASRIRKAFTDNVLTGDYKANPDSDILNLGIYVQDEIKINKWEFIPGIRYALNKIDAYADQDWYDSGSNFLTDKKSSVGKPISKEYSNWVPSFAAIYNINNNLNFYGKYSRAFRAPSWEDLNSSHINFTQYSAYTTVGNPNLKEETADNYELGLKGRSNNSDFGISGFLNKYNNFLDKSNKTGNKVAYQVTDAAELNKTFPQVFNRFGAPAASGTIQATEYQTRNIFDVQIWGIEADYKYHFSERNKGLSFTASASYVVGENQTDNERLDTVNPFTAITTFEYKFPNNKFSASLTNTYVGVPTPSDTYKKGQEDRNGNFNPATAYIPDSFITTDLSLNYKASERFSANLGIYNLFDTTYYLWSDLRSNGISGNDDDAYQRYAQPGTSLKAGFKWRF
tara:strand:+ start:381 stop:2825 length:2445 start_codon:yes stop_codon:yes gene_type:complete